MPVSAYIIKASIGSVDRVLRELEKLDHAKVGAVQDQSIPLSVFTESDRASREMGAFLDGLSGVEQSVLVYHNFEDAAELGGEPVPMGLKDNG